MCEIGGRRKFYFINLIEVVCFVHAIYFNVTAEERFSMRKTRMLLAGCGIMAALLIGSGSVDAQIRRRPAASRAPIATRSIQRGAVSGTVTRGPGQTGPITPEPGNPDPIPPIQQTLTLRSDVPPANGPEGAQGVAILSQSAEGVLLEAGTITISGLPAGIYDAWVVFSDPLIGEGLFSQLAAQLTIAQDTEQADAVMVFGTLVGREYGTLRQIVITTYSDIGADIGGEPVAGGAGRPGWPGAETAQLAADMQPPVDDTPEPQPAAQKRAVNRRMSPVQRRRIR